VARNEQSTGSAHSLSRIAWTPVPTGGGRRPDLDRWVVLGAADLGLPLTRVPDLSALSATVAGSRRPPEYVFVPCTDRSGPGPGAPAAAAAVRIHAEARTLLTAWLADERITAAGCRLVFVTFGALAVRDGEAVPGRSAAAVWGLVRAGQSAAPGRFTLIDLDDRAASRAALPAALTTRRPRVGIRAGMVLAPGLIRLDPDGRTDALAGAHAASRPTGRGGPPPPPRTLDPTGTVLLTSAAGAAAALFGRRLARAGLRTFVLVHTMPETAAGAEALATELAALGAQVTVAAWDPADPDSLTRLLTAAGPGRPLTAVVHPGTVPGAVLGPVPRAVSGAAPRTTSGAVSNAVPNVVPAPLPRTTSGGMSITASATAPGALGCLDALGTPGDPRTGAAAALATASALHQATAQADPALFLLLSPATGLFGSGTADQRASGAAFDALAQHRRACGLAGVSVAYDPEPSSDESQDCADAVLETALGGAHPVLVATRPGTDDPDALDWPNLSSEPDNLDQNPSPHVEWTILSTDGLTVPPADAAGRWAVIGGGSADLPGWFGHRYRELLLIGTIADVVVAPFLPTPAPSLDPGPEPARDPDAAKAAAGLLRAWLAAYRFDLTRLVVLTSGAVATAPRETISDPELALVWDVVRAAQTVHPGRFVLIDADPTERTSLTLLPTAVATGEPQLALRSGQILAARNPRATA
jgi:KR domain